ncbi:hypothetical protein [uncultured Maricaulis sp.]|uniref:hypothetical protein n=1 Tax=uncultured Maricaulis sp. TaxID=174710 RepID=UPI0030DCFE9E
MLGIIRITAITSAVLLGGAAFGQPTHQSVPRALDAQADEAAAAAELLLLETLRRRATSPTATVDTDNEDAILIVAEGPDSVVCRWQYRNGSHFRERRCRSRFQAQREERQAAYAMRRLRGF